MEQPELVWLAQYRNGDAEALGRLVEHFRRPLYSFILKMMEGKGDVEDVFQEVWFRAIRALPAYKDDKFLSWLFRIAHNLVIDRARKARPVVDIQAATDDGEDPIETRLADRSHGPADLSADTDLGRRIRAAVAALPAEQREVFLLRTEGDVPFKEIAKMQGTSINTALGRMHYAVQKLRDTLKDDYSALSRGGP